jgi:ubiquitin-protein ligase
MSTDRLLNEYNELKNKKPLGAFGGPKNINNLYDWEVTIPGPVNSPYEGGKFKVEVSFPSDYPNSPPKCKFITKVFHPNINFENGSICVNFLKQGNDDEKAKKEKTYTNKYNICSIILGLYALLRKPNQGSPLNSNAHNLYVKSNERYAILAKSFTKKFAK